MTKAKKTNHKRRVPVVHVGQLIALSAGIMTAANLSAFEWDWVKTRLMEGKISEVAATIANRTAKGFPTKTALGLGIAIGGKELSKQLDKQFQFRFKLGANKFSPF